MDGICSRTGAAGDDQHGLAGRGDTDVLLDAIQFGVYGVDYGVLALDGAGIGIRISF